jgi:hypothetical protein
VTIKIEPCALLAETGAAANVGMHDGASPQSLIVRSLVGSIFSSAWRLTAVSLDQPLVMKSACGAALGRFLPTAPVIALPQTGR